MILKKTLEGSQVWLIPTGNFRRFAIRIGSEGFEARVVAVGRVFITVYSKDMGEHKCRMNNEGNHIEIDHCNAGFLLFKSNQSMIDYVEHKKITSYISARHNVFESVCIDNMRKIAEIIGFSDDS